MAELHQWFTPRWVAEAIVERHLADVTSSDTVLDPSCGDGRFLMAIPDHVGAIGVEIDPRVAAIAAESSGRPVIVGDFLAAEIPPVTHIIGNPPFDAKVIHAFLDRAHALLPAGGTCGLLLPAYVLQTSSKVLLMNRNWSISQELMPRNIFPRLKLPLVFANFRKDGQRRLFGFFLYREAADVRAMPKATREALASGVGKGSVWRRAVRSAFDALGGLRATLADLYATIERPSANQFWREKVRQVLQTYPEFRQAGPGVWELAA